MINNIVIAMVGGLVGRSVMTGMMLVGKQLKLPAVDAHGILGYVQYAHCATALSYVMHWAMGAVFAVGYALWIRPRNHSLMGYFTLMPSGVPSVLAAESLV